MRELRRHRDIRSVEAFRINWQNALKEAESYSDSKMESPFDEKMKAVKILCEIQFMYRKDDIDGYLRYLDKNRDVLKADSFSQSIGSVDVPL